MSDELKYLAALRALIYDRKIEAASLNLSVRAPVRLGDEIHAICARTYVPRRLPILRSRTVEKIIRVRTGVDLGGIPVACSAFTRECVLVFIKDGSGAFYVLKPIEGSRSRYAVISNTLLDSTLVGPL